MSTAPLRIALFHNSPGGGAKRAAYELAKGLRRRGHHLDVFVPETANERYLPLAPLGVTVRVYSLRDWSKQLHLRPDLLQSVAWLVQYWIIAQLCAWNNRHIAHDINCGHYDVVWVDSCQLISSPFILRYLKAPTVYFCHEPWRGGYEVTTDSGQGVVAPPRCASWIHAGYAALCETARRWRRAYLRGVDRANARCAMRIVTNSEYTKQYIVQAYGASAAVSYLGVETSVFRPFNRPRERFVLSVGRLRPVKRHDLTIRALGRIPSDRRPPLVIITEWSTDQQARLLEACARDHGVELQLIKNITDEELVRWYNRAGVVVYSAVKEPFGLVTIEAMACGAPVVGVREGGLQETISHGRTGFLVEAAPDAIAKAIQTVLDDPALQKRMGSAGIELVRQRWTWEAAVDRFEQHLRTVSTILT
ncbi:MAG: glycosyltransferase family 4 protein [Candidatus Omnitrophica bacterium]|nr:glycosyltransferase family 4 protein [Candidatus Omnitrophota bacterium]